MKVLVIGGTGFIGSRTVVHLVERGVSVRVFHRGRTHSELPREVERILGDRDDLASCSDPLRARPPDVVLDMTALTETHARDVLAVFRGVARRVVAVSSMDVYRAYGVLNQQDDGPIQPVPLTEESTLRPRLFPARELPGSNRPPDRPPDYEKILVERMYLSDSALPATILRLPIVYGPGDARRHRTFPYVRRMTDGRPVILLSRILSRWAVTRGYVDDVAAGIVDALLAELPHGRIFNVGEAVGLTELAWVRKLARVAQWPGRIVLIPDGRMPKELEIDGNFAQDWVLDTSRIRRELSYHERVDPDDAISRTIRWERDNPPATSGSLAQQYDAEDAALKSQPPNLPA